MSAFYNDYDNLRSETAVVAPSATTLEEIYFQNNLEGDTYGFELSADYQAMPWWRLNAGYDLLMETIHVKPGQTDVNNALAETADPENQVFLRSSMDLPGHAELDANGRWIDTVRYNNGGTPAWIPDYFELDVRATWHMTRNIDVSAVGQNLLHAQHPEAPSGEQIVRSGYGELTCRF